MTTAKEFKVLTVLRTRVPLRSIATGDDKPVAIPPKTRVVVMSTPETGKTKVKVQDPKRTELAELRVIASNGAFTDTHRGRPVGSGKPKTPKAKAEKLPEPENF